MQVAGRETNGALVLVVRSGHEVVDEDDYSRAAEVGAATGSPRNAHRVEAPALPAWRPSQRDVKPERD
jgi:hypothetical protein